MSAKTYQAGERVDYTPTADVPAGKVVMATATHILGVATADLPANVPNSLACEPGTIYEVSETIAGAAVGLPVYADSTGALTATATSNTLFGHIVGLAPTIVRAVFAFLIALSAFGLIYGGPTVAQRIGIQIGRNSSMQNGPLSLMGNRIDDQSVNQRRFIATNYSNAAGEPMGVDCGAGSFVASEFNTQSIETQATEIRERTVLRPITELVEQTVRVPVTTMTDKVVQVPTTVMVDKTIKVPVVTYTEEKRQVPVTRCVPTVEQYSVPVRSVCQVYNAGYNYDAGYNVGAYNIGLGGYNVGSERVGARVGTYSVDQVDRVDRVDRVEPFRAAPVRTVQVQPTTVCGPRGCETLPLTVRDNLAVVRQVRDNDRGLVQRFFQMRR